MVGLVVGLTRFIWESVYGSTICGEEDDKPAIIADVHYLHFGCILFAIVFIVCVVVSLLTQPIPDEHVSTTKLLFLIWCLTLVLLCCFLQHPDILLPLDELQGLACIYTFPT